MLSSLNTKAKLMLIPIVYVLIVIIAAITFSHYNSLVKSRIDISTQTEIFIQQVLKGRIGVYQFSGNPSSETSSRVIKVFEVLDNSVKDLKDKLTVEDNIKTAELILEKSKTYINYFNQVSQIRLKDIKNGILVESPEIKPIIAKMVNTGQELEKELNKINDSAIELTHEAESSLNTILITIVVISLIIFILFTTILSNVIVSSINKFKDGLSSFFAYINRETDETILLDISGKDEFALMAKEVNDNISKTKAGLTKDNETVKEALDIVEKANQGFLDLQLKTKPNNPQLVQLCNALNSMLSGIKHNVDSINSVLTEFSNYKFTSKIDDKNVQGDIASLIKNVNFLTDEISTLLKQSYVIGLTLDESSDKLIINVDTLNTSSNEAAASLEETAAALEEITSTIINNSENVQAMNVYSDKLTKSAKTGQTLAQNTSKAMEDITEQVNSISEAITVIDQIAFQTNILSLNAAVEAATAGEAGKGFAVVAAEVRNLAARSAEAAKEIKELVENATVKAGHGKDISNQMINGYKDLLVDIEKSTEKISEIANSSKEQEQGITQINDAITQLDQQTQKNAQIASQTHDIAMQTDSIAKEIVADARAKEFLGKNDAKSRNSSTTKKSVERKEVVSELPKKNILKKEIVSEKAVSKSKVITSQTNDDEWESF